MKSQLAILKLLTLSIRDLFLSCSTCSSLDNDSCINKILPKIIIKMTCHVLVLVKCTSALWCMGQGYIRYYICPLGLCNTVGYFYSLLSFPHNHQPIIITQVEYMLGDSHIWSGLMKIKNDLLRMGKFTVGDGHKPVFGRVPGWITLLSKVNIHPCITLYRRRVQRWQQFLDRILWMCPLGDP
jgi:hypothetical protein